MSTNPFALQLGFVAGRPEVSLLGDGLARLSFTFGVVWATQTPFLSATARVSGSFLFTMLGSAVCSATLRFQGFGWALEIKVPGLSRIGPQDAVLHVLVGYTPAFVEDWRQLPGADGLWPGWLAPCPQPELLNLTSFIHFDDCPTLRVLLQNARFIDIRSHDLSTENR